MKICPIIAKGAIGGIASRHAHSLPNMAYKVFPIWNISDRYVRHGDQSKVKQGIVNDITHYSAGYSIDEEAKRMRAFEDWGHVMTANDLYEREIDGVVLRDLIWNWIDGNGRTSHIDH